MGDIKGAKQVRWTQGLLPDKTINSYLVLEQNSLKIDNHLREVITYFIFQLSIIIKVKYRKGTELVL